MLTQTMMSRRCRSILAAAVTGVVATSALGATQTSTWAGPAGSNWNNAAHWSPTGVPNNGTNGFSDYNVIIGAPSPAVLDINVAIDSLTVNAGSQLTINPAITLTINGPTITDNGVIQVDTYSSNANLNFAGNTTISGSGSIFLDDNNPHPTINSSAGVTVTQSAGHTIGGSGTVNAALVNNGTVNANFSGQSLILQTSAMTNNGLFESTGGGTLSINGIVVTQGTGGQILSGTGGFVGIANATISGGLLNAASGSSISVTNSTLTNVNVASGTLVVLTSGTNVNISGGSLINNGTIQVDPYSSNANLNFTTNTVVSGAGKIFLDDNNPHPTLNSAAGATVNFSSGQIVDGSGTVNAAVINNGIINADFNGQSLILQTSNMANNNLFESTGGGTLIISGISINQSSAGLIKSDNVSSVSINNSIINGGTINAASGGVINVTASTFNSVTIGAGTKVVIQPASVLTITGGTLVNNGLIQVDAYSSDAQINFAANTTLSGTGSIFLDDNNPKPSVNTSAGAVLTQSAGHTIYGSGEIDANFVNNGLVNANFSGQSLVIQANPKTNNAVFEATGGGYLNITGTTVTQGTGGLITTDGTSHLSIYGGATIVGGTINAATGSEVDVTNATFNSVTIGTGTKVVVASGQLLTIAGGALTNNGTIQVDTLGSGAVLNFTASTTIAGTGSINLDTYGSNAVLNSSAGTTIKQSAGQSIYGVGEVDASLVNNGTVNANYPGHILLLQNRPMTNNSLFQATATGTLAINGIAVTQTGGGQIAADNVSSVSIYNGANIIGGTINASTGGSVTTSSATFTNVAITTGTTVVVAAGTTLNIAGGSLVNNGTVQVDQFSGNSDLNFTAAASSVTGAGTIFLDSYGPNAKLTTAAPADTVTIASTQLIHGVGEIDASLVNNGTVDADFGGHALVLQTNPMTNNGLFEATSTGILNINGITVTQAAGAQIRADNVSSVSINSGANIVGGTINASTGGSVSTNSATFTNVAITTGTTVVVAAGTTLNIAGGSLVNNGTVQVDQFSTNANLNFIANTSVTGTGTIFLDDYNPNARITAVAGTTTTFGPGQTIHGVGEIDGAVINAGVINADFNGHTLFVNGPINNTGTLEATAGGTLNLTGSTVTSGIGNTIAAASSSAVVIASLNATNTTLNGAGTIYLAAGTFSGTTTNNTNLVIGGTVSLSGALVGTGTTTFNSGSSTQAVRVQQSGFIVNGTVTIPVVRPIVSSNTVGILGTLSIGATGTFDTGDADIDITATPLSTVNGYVASGFNSGSWTGYGLTSSAARTDTSHLTTLGVIQNNQGGTALFTSTRKFDGLTVGPGDVLVRYTFFGDANLDGKVDGSDYSRIDNGYITHATGWYNGDFNYDGSVDGSDYTLIDNAYNRQTAQFLPTALVAAPAALTAPAAVPEPAAVAILAAAAAAISLRRRHS